MKIVIALWFARIVGKHTMGTVAMIVPLAMCVAVAVAISLVNAMLRNNMPAIMLTREYNEGYNARYSGRSHRLCPYTGVQAQDWLAGWYLANNEMS